MSPWALEELPTIECERLLLRGMVMADAEALLTIFSDSERLHFWGHGPLSDLTAAQRYVQSQWRGVHAGARFQWGIEVNRELVGCCALASLDPHHLSASLNYVLSPLAGGQGFAREAAAGVLSFGFSVMGLKRIEADTDPRHERSIAVLNALGFQREGLLRSRYSAANERQDALVFGLLEADWQSA